MTGRRVPPRACSVIGEWAGRMICSFSSGLSHGSATDLITSRHLATFRPVATTSVLHLLSACVVRSDHGLNGLQALWSTGRGVSLMRSANGVSIVIPVLNEAEQLMRRQPRPLDDALIDSTSVAETLEAIGSTGIGPLLRHWSTTAAPLGHRPTPVAQPSHRSTLFPVIWKNNGPQHDHRAESMSWVQQRSW